MCFFLQVFCFYKGQVFQPRRRRSSATPKSFYIAYGEAMSEEFDDEGDVEETEFLDEAGEAGSGREVS